MTVAVWPAPAEAAGMRRSAPSVSERPAAVALDRVVAVVDDEVVLISELRRSTERHPMFQEAMTQLPGNASADARRQKRRDVESKVLDELIELTLLRKEAAKFEIVISDEDVDNAMKDIAKQNQMTVEELRAQVEDSEAYESWSEYRDELRDQIVQFKVPHYLTTWSVSDAQVREHYRQTTKDESAKVQVWQFRFTPATQERTDLDRAFATAQGTARRLRDGEEPAGVAASLVGGEASEREVGRGGIAPVLEDALFAAERGDVVGPTPSGSGYLVFVVQDKVDSAALAYDEVKDRIRTQLENEAFFKAVTDLRRQLRAKAHIDIRL